MKNLFLFIKSKIFLKHLFIYLLIVALISWIIVFYLGSYTSHGNTIKVPDFTGKKIGELDGFVSDKDVRYMIIDSVYDLKSQKGLVIRQDPEHNAEVKSGRMIYLYVTSLKPPSIQMPKLIDRSIRQALSMLTTYGLKLGNIKYVPDQCTNCVLEQFANKKKIEVGETLVKGTIIDLTVGKGLSDEEIEIPCLFGLTRKEALEKLAESSLNIGALTFEIPKDSSLSKVFKQIPNCTNEKTIKMGASIDLFFTTNLSKIPVISKDSLNENKNLDESFDN